MRPPLLIVLFILTACKQGAFKPVETTIKAPGIEVHHDGSAEHAPVVTDKTSKGELAIPAGSKLTVVQEKGTATAIGADSKPVNVPVDRITTVIELPPNVGTTLVSTNADVSVTGSTGHAPPPPPTPYQTSLSAWTYVGIGIFALGVFFCTPWGGSNFRVGGLIALGGVTMGITGSLLGSLSEVGLPKWFPAVGIVGVIAGIVLYWGYRLREKQHAEGTVPIPT